MTYFQRFPTKTFATRLLPLLVLQVLSILTVVSSGVQLVVDVGFVAAAVLGFITAILLIQWAPFFMHFGQPMLKIDEKGFWCKGLIVPWSYVSGIRLINYGGVSSIGVELLEDGSGIRTLPRFIRNRLQRCAFRTGVHILIPQAREASAQEVESVMIRSFKGNVGMFPGRAVSYEVRPSEMRLLVAIDVFIIGLYCAGFNIIVGLQGRDYSIALTPIIEVLILSVVSYAVLYIVARLWPRFDLWALIGHLTP